MISAFLVHVAAPSSMILINLWSNRSLPSASASVCVSVCIYAAHTYKSIAFHAYL